MQQFDHQTLMSYLAQIGQFQKLWFLPNASALNIKKCPLLDANLTISNNSLVLLFQSIWQIFTQRLGQE